MLWSVVPLCERQLRDVNPKDVLDGGLFRLCNIYKGGGGYDRFDDIYRSRHMKVGTQHYNMQFVVQLQGCPFKCPYCYVTRDGIMGESRLCTAGYLVDRFNASGASVFHLMGGAPALYLDGWADLMGNLNLNEKRVFHSDFLLQESRYTMGSLYEIAKFRNALFAVSIKGSTPEEYKKNTGVDLNEDMFWDNLFKLGACNVPFYMTFTGMSDESIANFKAQVKREFPRSYEKVLKDSFKIDIVQYEALKD